MTRKITIQGGPAGQSAEPKGAASNQHTHIQRKAEKITSGASQAVPGPPVYRPQPTPRVLQRKERTVGPADVLKRPTVSVYRPQPTPRVLQTKRTSAPAVLNASGGPRNANLPGMLSSLHSRRSDALQLMKS